MKLIRPAPKWSGETSTWPEATLAVTSIGAAARGVVGEVARAAGPERERCRHGERREERVPRTPRCSPHTLGAHWRNPSPRATPTAPQGAQNGRSTTWPPTPAPADLDQRPGRGLPPDHGERDRAERGGDDGRPDPPHVAAFERDRVVLGDGRIEPEPAQVPVGLSPVVQAGDRLLADVAALGEADGASVDARLLRDRGGAHLAPEAGASRLDAQDLGRRLGDLDGAGLDQRPGDVRRPAGRADEVDAEVGGDGAARRPRQSGARGGRARGQAGRSRPARWPRGRAATGSPARSRAGRSRPGAPPCRSRGAARPHRPRQAPCPATPRGRAAAAPACQPACGPCGPAGRRSSRFPGRAPRGRS